MSGQISEEIIRLIVDRLVSGYAPEQVILFGSYAYGTPHDGSDVDLLVIKETETPAWDRIAEARRAVDGAHPGVRIDFHVRTPQEINVRLGKGDHFIEDIFLKGRCLYGDSTWRREKVIMPEDAPSYPMEWVINAERDLRLVSLILNDQEDSYGAAFHLQQALEKVLKGFLLHHGWRLERSHDLATLLDLARSFDEGMGHYSLLCEQVSNYYFADRYPDSDIPAPTLAEVRDNLTTVRELVGRTKELIGG